MRMSMTREEAKPDGGGFSFVLRFRVFWGRQGACFGGTLLGLVFACVHLLWPFRFAGDA